MIPYNYARDDLARISHAHYRQQQQQTAAPNNDHQQFVTTEVAVYTTLSTALFLLFWLWCGLTRWRMRETWHHYESLLLEKKKTQKRR